MSETASLARTKYCIISSYPSEVETNDHASSSFLVGSRNYPRYLLIKFAQPDAKFLHRGILSAEFNISGQIVISAYFSVTVAGQALKYDFDANTATYAAVSDILGSPTRIIGEGEKYGGGTFTFAANDARQLVSAALAHGVAIYARIYGAEEDNARINTHPTLALTFSDENCHKIITGMTIDGRVTTATINRALPHVFAATLGDSAECCLSPPETAAVKFRYRPKGTDTYTEVELGTETSYSLAGNLMPAGDMEYQFAVTDSLGYTSTSDWATVQTTIKTITSRSPGDDARINRLAATLFIWVLVSGCSATKFLLRKQGAETYTEYTLTEATSYTLPPGTIEDGGIYEWGVKTTDVYGRVWIHSGFTINTVDALPSAATVSPSGGIIDADADNTFTWQHIISSGSPQTKAELQKSSDGKSWTELVTVEDSATTCIIPAGTLTKGTWYWRVRTYNLDSVASEWSSAAQVLAIGAPSTPILTLADNSPRPVINWQATEQEAWELTLDRETTTVYGTGKTWRSPKYLTPGVHTVSVRVQNQYSRWSKHGTLEFEVVNNEGPALMLTVEGHEIALLAWQGSGYDFFVIERDGNPIAKTEDAAYSDIFACGVHTYRVRGCYNSSNNYGLSNSVTAEIVPETPVIIDTETQAVLKLDLSDQQHRTWGWSRTRQTSLYHVSGRALPSAEIGEFVDETLSGTAAFDTREDQMTLEAMLGRVVCLKTDSGDAATGVLTEQAKTVGMFYSVYSLSVTNTDREEVVDLDA